MIQGGCIDQGGNLSVLDIDKDDQETHSYYTSLILEEIWPEISLI